MKIQILGLAMAASVSTQAAVLSKTVLTGHLDPRLTVTSVVAYETTDKDKFFCQKQHLLGICGPWSSPKGFDQGNGARLSQDGDYDLQIQTRDDLGVLCHYAPKGDVVLRIKNKTTGHVNETFTLSSKLVPNNFSGEIVCLEDAAKGTLECTSQSPGAMEAVAGAPISVDIKLD